MLLELRVENYAVLDSVTAEFGPGLNLLTGETGAGKSLLIDALSLLLGEKSSSEMVRHGTERAVVCAVFEVAAGAADPILAAHGLESEGAELIVRREIAATGKGRVFVNNQPATVAVLRQLAPWLATVHAQNESIFSFDAAARLALLDSFAGGDLAPVSAAFEQWKSLRDRIADLDREEQDRLRLLDLWKFQQKEIHSARPEAGEDARLESERRILANAERVRAAAMGAYDLLYESQGSSAATLRSAARHVEELARLDASMVDSLAALESARLSAEDVATSLREYAERASTAPERLAEVEDRLALLDRLKRKYGASLEEVIAFGEDVARKIDEAENRDEVLHLLRQQLAAAAKEFLGLAQALSAARASAAKTLEKQVEQEIGDLAMKARFQVAIDSGEEETGWSASGIDRVGYLISANPGEPLGPLEKIASGGELSRVMLALRATIESGARAASRKSKPLRTLVFDEIDSGIGGKAAEAVGRKLKALARGHQVLCVTHLPQIASFADHHLVVEKREAGGRTSTRVRLLEDAGRTEELARMLSGAQLTETSRRHALQLLKTKP
ncbi:MAG: DNA repair protein RecN [Terriglobales bacterium]